jgi:hypothetical protein
MESETEALESFYFLEEENDSQVGQGYRLEIRTLNDTIVSVDLDSLSRTQRLKEQIYDVLIGKQEEHFL